MDEVKLCACGCGEPAAIAKYTNNRRGHIKGFPMLMAAGHRLKQADSPNWNGGKIKKLNGYICVLRPEHPRADSKGYVYEHILMAEDAIGKPLPLGSEVHHRNEIKSDNRNDNFIICQDHSYHMLIHARTVAFRATGDPNLRQCTICKSWGCDVEKVRSCNVHRVCLKRYQQEKEAARPKRSHLKKPIHHQITISAVMDGTR